MRHVDEESLETDTAKRFAYLAEFLEFSPQDIDALHLAVDVLVPAVPTLVDAVYKKLQQFDATWRHFVPRQAGYGGPLAERVDRLKMDDPVILFRKQHLARYLKTLVTAPYDAKMVSYLDAVGKMHTPKGGSAEIDVPLVQMNALLGFVSDALLDVVLNAGLDARSQANLLRAINKLLWIQNDFISRHYQASRQPDRAAG